jgi:UDP-2-acetamido-3-amino-2,3-dideoxy-glucuronate N-acetyltransferase
VVERGVEIGNNVKVQNNVSIYSGVILEDDVFCGPSMVFTNVGTPRSHYPRRDAYSITRIGRGASIGANATVVCGYTLGRYCFVGAGAVVTRDVPDFALVYGNPARVRGWTCYCGCKLNFTPQVNPSRPQPDDHSLHDSDTVEFAHCDECSRSYEKRGELVTPLAPLETS